MQQQKAEKNIRGALGPICNYCGGYGFTNSMATGGSAGCPRCFGSGIQPVDMHALNNQVQELTKAVNQLIKIKENKNEPSVLGRDTNLGN